MSQRDNYIAMTHLLDQASALQNEASEMLKKVDAMKAKASFIAISLFNAGSVVPLHAIESQFAQIRKGE